MFKTLCASAHNIPLPDSSVHAIITSPPYYGLRAYSGEQLIEWPAVTYAPMPGLPPVEIAGCDPDCDHVWGKPKVIHQRGPDVGSTLDSNQNRGRQEKATTGQYCQLCGGWRGGLGQEPTVDAYVGHLILCLREWRRILRADGCAFVNLGDSYSGSGGSGGDYAPGGIKAGQPKTKGAKANGIPPKNLLLVPERFRLAAQADGWYIRSQFSWVKRSSLPESVTDRPSNSAESWVMLTKSQHYFWDAEAVKVEAANAGVVVSLGEKSFSKGQAKGAGVLPSGNGNADTYTVNGTRNRRTGDWLFESLDASIAASKQWVAHAEHVRDHQGLLLNEEGDPLAMLVNPRPFVGAHFAAYPAGVVEPLVLGSTSAKGCCGVCGNPCRRVVESKPALADDGKTCLKCGKNHGKPKGKKHDVDGAQEAHMADYLVNEVFVCVERTTTGWEPGCTCNPGEPIPCTVLDPFVGSGTTCEVATALGRHSIGVDISQQYLDEVLPIRFQDGVQIGFQF